MVIGPVIEEGFYYDIWNERPFTPEDLAAIEQRMVELIDTEYDVIKKMTPRDEVIAEFKARGEDYKLRLIEDMPDEKAMGLYYHQDYVDMCRGPHVPNTRFLKAFKLTRISGAYWRGDAKNEQLAACLRHRLGRQEATGCLHHAHRGSREARPPQARQAARPVPHAGRGARPGVLASKGMADLADRRAAHAPGLPRFRLRRNQMSADPRQEPLGKDRALAELSREHVHHLIGESRLCVETDELPRSRDGLQPRPAQLSRIADSLRRVRIVHAQRAFGCAARTDAGARLCPGRRPHFLH